MVAQIIYKRFTYLIFFLFYRNILYHTIKTIFYVRLHKLNKLDYTNKVVRFLKNYFWETYTCNWQVYSNNELKINVILNERTIKSII